MRNLCYLLALLFCGVCISSCTSTDEPEFFIADKVPLNEADSLIIMELYAACRIEENGSPYQQWVKRHPDTWKGIEYEIVGDTIRYVSGIKMTGCDSVPSSLGKLEHLKKLHLKGIPNIEYVVPVEIFNCPLESLYLGSSYPFIKGKRVTLPKEMYKIKSTLRYLELYFISLTELPEWFGDFTDLEECKIIASQLTGKVPEFFGDFKGRVILNGNYFTEFNWEMFPQGKNIPWCLNNEISNPIPAEIKSKYGYRIQNYFQGNNISMIR